MTLKQKLAEKMLKEKLDFLPFEESLLLESSDENIENTKFYWVFNGEMIGDDADSISIDEVKERMIEVHGDNNHFVIGKAYDEFNEFTVAVCNAPTYIDLIK